MKTIKWVALVSFILTTLLGVFLFIYGGYDDSPGAQGLGVLLFVGGIISLVKISKT